MAKKKLKDSYRWVKDDEKESSNTIKKVKEDDIPF